MEFDYFNIHVGRIDVGNGHSVQYNYWSHFAKLVANIKKRFAAHGLSRNVLQTLHITDTRILLTTTIIDNNNGYPWTAARLTSRSRCGETFERNLDHLTNNIFLVLYEAVEWRCIWKESSMLKITNNKILPIIMIILLLISSLNICTWIATGIMSSARYLCDSLVRNKIDTRRIFQHRLRRKDLHL